KQAKCYRITSAASRRLMVQDAEGTLAKWRQRHGRRRPARLRHSAPYQPSFGARLHRRGGTNAGAAGKEGSVGFCNSAEHATRWRFFPLFCPQFMSSTVRRSIYFRLAAFETLAWL